MRRSRPTPSRASCGSTATTSISSPAPTSTARRCSRPAPSEGLTAARAARPQRAAVRGDGRAAGLLERRLHPHHRGAPPPLVGGNLAAHGEERRHLSRQICRLVFGARRGLLRRERDASQRAEGARRVEDRHAGRVGGGGELFLPALGLSGQAAQALRAAELRAAEGAAATKWRASCAAACRTCRSRAPPSTGASACPATTSTSCMCGSTR